MNEAMHQLMESDERVILLGVGVNSPWYVGDSCKGLSDRFGDLRVIDIPVAENGITGVTVGAALAGMRPIMTHPRMDFMYLAFDQIFNHAAHWHYMLGGKVCVPVTVRGIINRGGEQGAQHSQSLQALFSHVPGLKVVMPSTPYDAKGLLISSVQEDNPVIYIDDRWLYSLEDDVPEEMYSVPLGEAAIRKEGKDVTVVATSYMVHEAGKAAEKLQQDNIDVELIDLRTVKPFDKNRILQSVHKTGRLVVVDAAWRFCGVAAEVAACVAEDAFHDLKAPPLRLTLPDVPAPSSAPLENAYYITAEKIASEIKSFFKTT